jgi:hypothetical protein
MPFFRVVPSELFIVAVDTLPVRAWLIVCNQIFRCESRAATLGLMRLRDCGQRFDDVDRLEACTERGCD